jgi:hypothetical protein
MDVQSAVVYWQHRPRNNGKPEAEAATDNFQTPRVKYVSYTEP